jgi:hypothetical protein
MKGEMKMTYILYIEHDDAPHDVSIFHESLTEAETSLREFAEEVLGFLPADEELIDKLAEYNEHVRIYEVVGRTSREVMPFEQLEEQPS